MLPLIKIEAWLVYFLYTKRIHFLYLTTLVYIFSIHQICIKQNFVLWLNTDVYYLNISLLHQGYDVYCVYTTHPYQLCAVPYFFGFWRKCACSIEIWSKLGVRLIAEYIHATKYKICQISQVKGLKYSK